jgi:small conductance mechanosensitive channel
MNEQTLDVLEEQAEALKELTRIATEFGVKYGFQVLGALVILAIGFVVAGWVGRLARSACLKRRVDVTLARFLGDVARVLVLVFVFIAALNNFGVTVAPLIAAVGALAFGSSLALAGPLSNYGAGVSIILARTFRVGDTITVQGMSGVVEDIRLGATSLQTEDGERVIIPNKEIVGQVLVNSFENRVVELSLPLLPDADPLRAAAVVREALASVAEVVQDPAPQVGIGRFRPGWVEVDVRYWVPTKRYFEVQFAANRAVWQALGAAGLELPPYVRGLAAG